MRSLRREPGVLLALLAVIVAVLIFIVYPQVRVVVTPGDSYVEFFTGGTWKNSLIHSLEVMALSTTTAVTLGFIYAYAMDYSDMHWKPFFRLIGILPLLSPPFVVAASYVILFGPRGIITYGVFGQTISVFGLLGVWGVQTIAFFPFAYQLIADVLSRSDARLEQAARNLGAGPWQVFRPVTLPLSGPGLGAAILTYAIYILEDFGNPQLIGGGFNVLPTQAYSLIEGFGDFTGAAAVSTILLLLALSLYFAKTSLDRGRSFVTVGGKASSMPRPPVPPLLTRACFAACLALAGLIGHPDLRAQLIVIALLFWNIPIAYQAVVVGLRQIDKSIDEAATSLGASSLRGFRDVLVPMLGGSVQVGFVTTFVRAVTTLSVVIFLFTPATTVATIRIYQLVNDLNWGGATAFTVADIGMAIVALVIFAALARGRIALGAARA